MEKKGGVKHMPQTQEVVRKKSVGVSPTGEQVVKGKTQVIDPETEKEAGKNETVGTIIQLVYYLTGILEILLGFRFILKVLGANPGSPFVSFIYPLSGAFENPFRGIFHSSVTQGIETGAVLEPSTLVAMLVYGLIAIGLVELVKLLTATREPVEE